MNYPFKSLFSYILPICLLTVGISSFFILSGKLIIFSFLSLAIGLQSLIITKFTTSNKEKDERYTLIIYKSSVFAYALESVIIFMLAILYTINLLSSIESLLIILIISNVFPFIFVVMYNAKKH